MTVSVVECMEKQLLHVVFQSIGVLSSGEIFGYEALARGPTGTHLESPLALVDQAQCENCMVELERFLARLSVSTFANTGLPGKLFLNFSAAAIREIARDRDGLIAFLDGMLFSSERIIIELTERTCPYPLPSLQDAVFRIREQGVQLALDDYGTGNANLGVWIALQPNYVKIDRSIVDGVSKSAFRLEALRLLNELAKVGHTQLIAEGLESIDDLAACRHVGIACAQGFLLGKPSAMPQLALPAQALEVIHAETITELHEISRHAPQASSANRLLIAAPSVSPETRSDDVLAIFAREANPHAIPIIVEGRPSD